MWTLEIRVINLGVSQEFPHTCLLITVFRDYLLAVNQSADCWVEYQAKKQHTGNIVTTSHNHPIKKKKKYLHEIERLRQYKKALLRAAISCTVSEMVINQTLSNCSTKGTRFELCSF